MSAARDMRRGGRHMCVPRSLLAIMLAGLLGASVSASAAAAAPQPLAKTPEDGVIGEAAGELNLPRGIAADAKAPGHVYVADGLNNRISEFTAWGEFVKAWGWNVNSEDPQEELQSCTSATGCRKGSGGTGAGQFNTLEALAVDGSGMVYAMDIAAGRIQKFDPDGGPGETASLVKSFGEKGAGPGQLSATTFGYLNRIAACPAGDDLFVGEGERIQRFDSEGVFEELIEMPSGKKVRAIAVDSACDVYVAFQGEPGVHKISSVAPYEELLEFEAESATERAGALALDGAGNLYAQIDAGGGEPERAQKYDSEGNCLTCGEDGEGGKPGFDRVSDGTALRSLAASGACHASGEGENAYLAHASPALSLAYLRAYEVPDPTIPGCEPPPAAPTITAQYAVSVGTEEAQIRANINPKFWAGSVGTTNFYAQWGTAACIEAEGFEGPCAQTTATPPGPALDAPAVNEPVPSAILGLEGLEPGTTYAYRFIAISDGGGPTIGAEARLTTPRTPTPIDCPGNAEYRSGPSAPLPDCRAYELVSPLDKDGGDIIVLPHGITGLPATLSQSAIGGAKMAYGSYRAFGDAEAAPLNTQYLATRQAGVGWSTHAISPPVRKNLYTTGKRFDNEYRAFSGDLCMGWVQTFADPQPAPEAPEGFSDLYRRTDQACGGAPDYAPLNTTTPPSLSGELFYLELQGRSEDGLAAIFTANDKLTADATAGVTQLYGRRGSLERMLCVLPEDGGAISGDCTAGGNFGAVKITVSINRTANVQGAISADGERVFWTATSGGPGPIYARERPFGEGTDCSGPEAPCSFPVSEDAETEEGTTGSQFKAAALDGSRALFTTNGSLYEYDLEEGEGEKIAGEVVGFLGASEDATRSYFVSEEDLAPGAVAGEGNLYFHEAGGAFQWIGILEGADLALESLSPIAPYPYLRNSRVSPDGLSMALTAQSALTAYDNADLITGEADAEVYLYDAGAEEVLCASCNPSGARPRGEVVAEGNPTIRSAARLPVFQNILYGSRPLTPDGDRLFFSARDSLVPTDTNEREDVYQWEAAGKGTCTTASGSYSPANGGCVDLISSGRASLDARFLDADESGDNVFFTTVASLVPQDYGLVDVYVARVNGGLPGSPPPAPQCEGEACQSPPPAPEPANPASRTYSGPGNLRETAARNRCAAPARKAKRLSRRAKALRAAARKQARRGNAAKATTLAGKAVRYARLARKKAGEAKRCRARVRKSQRSSR